MKMVESFVGFDTSDIAIDEGIDEEITNVESPKLDYKEQRLSVNKVGRAIIGDEIDAYRVWVTKCLLTERYRYLAYSTDFGVEIERIIRENYPRGIAESELERTIKEALLMDNRTVSVRGFSFAWEGDAVYVDFYVEHIYGTDYFELMRGGDEIGSVRIRAT